MKDQREAFEAWLKSELENTLDQDGKDYILSNKELCRHVFQAALASQAQQPSEDQRAKLVTNMVKYLGATKTQAKAIVDGVFDGENTVKELFLFQDLPNTLAGFLGGCAGSGVTPTQQMIYDAGVKSGMNRMPSQAQPTQLSSNPLQLDDHIGADPDCEWNHAEIIANLYQVDDVIRGFAEDPCGDNGTMIVREVIRAIQAQQESQWISVEDRLPEPWEDVLVHPRPTEYICEANMGRSGGAVFWEYSEYIQNYGVQKVRCEVTHWIPLPPAPEEDEP